jgi:hypothetical protein
MRKAMAASSGAVECLRFLSVLDELSDYAPDAVYNAKDAVAQLMADLLAASDRIINESEEGYKRKAEEDGRDYQAEIAAARAEFDRIEAGIAEIEARDGNKGLGGDGRRGGQARQKDDADDLAEDYAGQLLGHLMDVQMRTRAVDVSDGEFGEMLAARFEMIDKYVDLVSEAVLEGRGAEVARQIGQDAEEVMDDVERMLIQMGKSSLAVLERAA